MKQIFVVLLIAAFAVPAMGRSCSGGKCMSPKQREVMKRNAMKQRLATPLRTTPAIQKINQQIMILSRTNVRGQNRARIAALYQQRNQMLKAQR